MTGERLAIELVMADGFDFECAGLGADPRVLGWKWRSVEDRANCALLVPEHEPPRQMSPTWTKTAPSRMGAVESL